MGEMHDVLRQALLYDFYGELLTEHQRTVYEEVTQNDLSYSEAAETFGVSRQGVHELIKRCNKLLEGYEDRMHLVEKFLRIRGQVQEIQEELNTEQSREHLICRVRSLTEDILKEL